MVGKKTKDHQGRIIEGKVDTTDADPDFDPRPDLKASEKREDRKKANDQADG